MAQLTVGLPGRKIIEDARTAPRSHGKRRKKIASARRWAKVSAWIPTLYLTCHKKALIKDKSWEKTQTEHEFDSLDSSLYSWGRKKAFITNYF
jgi:hypothetical protein